MTDPSDEGFGAEADTVLRERLVRVARLTWDQASALPEANGESESIGGHRHDITTFRQSLGTGILVTVQIARPAVLGLASRHWERGLVFVQGEEPREATQAELDLTGS